MLKTGPWRAIMGIRKMGIGGMIMNRKNGALGGRLTLSWTEMIMGGGIILLGLILLLIPGVATSVLFNGIGAVCILIGLVHAVKYFTLNAREAVISNDMALGLAWIVGGLSVIIFKGLLVSLLPSLFGLVILVGGVIKIQSTMGFKRMNSGRWYWELICAAVSVVLGILILANPFSTALLMMRVIGISLLIEGGMDLVSRIAYKKACDRFIEIRFVD